MSSSPTIAELQHQIQQLQTENELLKKKAALHATGDAVQVPQALKPVFDLAQQTVNEYFQDLTMDPAKGTIEINDQRYVLVRASGLSKGFLQTIQHLYADRGEQEAMTIGKNFLFDIAHVIGLNDAGNFHRTMQLTDPIAKLSAGPVHFAYTGWAFVNILPESNPTPDENFYLFYEHPYSFEADSWVRDGANASTSVCIMNAGYSSGWCEASFGIPLTAVEVTCIAKGDDCCRFIMSPPEKIQEHIDRFHTSTNKKYRAQQRYEIPTFFERKKVEEEMQRSKLLAEESARSKSDFLANMSHELRTPLGAIVGFTDLLKKTKLDPVQSDYLEAISSSGKNLLSIINDVLDLSKIDAGRFIIEEIPFNVQSLLHSIQVMFSVRASEKGLNLYCDIDLGNLQNVLGDPMRLTQVLNNLVGNSIKFTQTGEVRIRCSKEREDEESVQLRFEISDTGIGIAPEKMETIFERFIQADSDITRKYGGTGLGLSITKQLIELQGGSIGVKSNPGKGTMFFFTITYKKTEHEIIDNRKPVTAFSAQAKKILVVEDNRMNQKLASILLSNNGYEVTLAENGEKAIELLKLYHYDCILMDLQMPILDGYQTTTLIREELKIHIPVIATTAHALAGEKEKCLSAGMNDYLSKPFGETDLIQKLSQWLSNEQEPPRLINTAFLEKHTRNNKAVIKEMAEIFIEENPKTIAEIEKAINENDYQRIFKATHLLRNTIAFFGLDKFIGAELLNMEKRSHAEQNLAEIQTDFEIVKSVCADAVKELHSLYPSI